MQNFMEAWSKKQSGDTQKPKTALTRLEISKQFFTEEEHRVNEKAYWDRRIEAYNRPNWIGIITFLAALVAAAGGVGSYRESKRQADIAQDTLGEIRNSSAQTDKAIKAAEESAQASAKQADIARDAEIQNLRPYVFFRQIDVPHLDASGNIVTGRKMENTGRSAAYDIQRAVFSSIMSKPIPGNGADLSYPDDSTIITIANIEFMPPQDILEGVTTQGIYDHNAWSSLITGDTNLVFVEWGTARYKDVFGDVHHLWFCSTWDGRASRTEKCPRGNRID